MPSDTNPEKLVPLCQNGMLDRDECKPVTAVYMEDYFAIYSGKTLRVKVTYEKYYDDDVEQGPRRQKYEEWGDRARINPILSYDYPTKYNMGIKQPDDVVFNVLGMLGHPNARDRKEYWPATVKYRGLIFKTGPMKMEDFYDLCRSKASVDKVPFEPKDIFVQQSDKAYSYYCMVGKGAITLQCENKDKQCAILGFMP